MLAVSMRSQNPSVCLAFCWQYTGSVLHKNR